MSAPSLPTGDAPRAGDGERDESSPPVELQSDARRGMDGLAGRAGPWNEANDQDPSVNDLHKQTIILAARLGGGGNITLSSTEGWWRKWR